ncbi:MAG: NUDIX hydrolase [Sandaracinaceae bacterium]
MRARLLPLVRLFPVALCLACGGPPPVTHPTTPPVAETPPAFRGLEGFWSAEQADVLLAQSTTFAVEADTSSLTASERRALGRLMEVGTIFHGVFEESRHREAPAVAHHLDTYSPASDAETAQLATLRRLYRLFEGPIAYSPEAERVPFAPVAPYEPGRNVYPAGLDAETLQTYLQAHPEQPEIAATRTVVRRRTEAALAEDRATFAAHPWLAALHPALSERLEAGPDPGALYAVPYSLAYADELTRASALLFQASADVRAEDTDLADYLEQRARDLLSNDYEAGDAAWVSGRFNHLQAEVGAYETYDDHLLSQKAFHAVSLLVRSPGASDDLARAVARLSDFESALPGGPYEQVRSQIPLGIYDVVADYGQARGGNTASILPNEAHITRKYGRTILIRRNVLTHPHFVEAAQRRFRAAVSEVHDDDLGPRGNFDRTVWHEVGHYLGPKTTEDGRIVTEALGNLHNHMEEMKADLVSLWLMPRLVELGVMDEDRRQAAYAAGILRSLVTSDPPRSNPYRTMQLMQQNWFLEHGVLSFDPETRSLAIDYEAYPAAVEGMLTEVLAIQRSGDRDRANAFVERWARWDGAVQGVLAGVMQGLSARYWIPEYAALESR